MRVSKDCSVMFQVSCPAIRLTRVLALRLLTTTAAAALLGACTPVDHHLFASNTQTSSSSTKLADNSASGRANAVTQWYAAYSRNPQDPKMVLGYSEALKAAGAKDQALEILKTAYLSSPTPSGEVAASLGRLALDMGRMDIAKATLQVAEAQGIDDWRTLSAQGTLSAKQGDHAKAQQYYLAALQTKPDAVSVINNLALDYALDGKAERAEGLLRKAVASGTDDTRVRQNLALVLGLEGKFGEAHQLASLDMSDTQAKENVSVLRDMVNSSGSTAVAYNDDGDDSAPPAHSDDWQPYGGGSKVAASTESPAHERFAAKPAVPQRDKPPVRFAQKAAPAARRATSAAPAVRTASAAPTPTAEAPLSGWGASIKPARNSGSAAPRSLSPMKSADSVTKGSTTAALRTATAMPSRYAAKIEKTAAPAGPSDLLRADVD